MKIVHICLASHYTEGLTYQDNLLTEQNRIDGHEVVIISNCSRYVNGRVVAGAPEDRIMANGIRLIRLPYIRTINNLISSKVRAVKGLYELLLELKPDVILHHGVNDWELFTVSKYKKYHPRVSLYCDTHTDYYTSGRNWLSINVLHRLFYKFIIHKCLQYIDKIFYISINCREFLNDIYKVPMYVQEFMPLGGFIPSDEDKLKDRIEKRRELGIKDNEIMLVHAGKMDSDKKTVELIIAFKAVERADMRLIIIGDLQNDIKEESECLISSDERIVYLGWKKGEELMKYLNACDIYIQPGKVSAIAQNAICSGCAVILRSLPDYKPFVENNGYLIKTESDIKEILDKVTLDQVERMKVESVMTADKFLNYKNIARKLYI